MADALPHLPSAPLGELQGQLPDDPLGSPPQLPSIGKREPLKFPFGGRGGRRTGGTRPPLASVEQLTRAAAQRRAQQAAGTTPAQPRPRPQRHAPPAPPIIIQTPTPQAAPQPAPEPQAPRPTAAQRRAAARQAAAPLRAYVGIGRQNPQDAADAAAQRGRIRRGLALRQRRPGQPAQPQNPPQAQPSPPTQDPALNAIRARRAAQYAQMRGVLDALRNPPANPPGNAGNGGTQP